MDDDDMTSDFSPDDLDQNDIDRFVEMFGRGLRGDDLRKAVILCMCVGADAGSGADRQQAQDDDLDEGGRAEQMNLGRRDGPIRSSTAGENPTPGGASVRSVTADAQMRVRQASSVAKARAAFDEANGLAPRPKRLG